MDGARLVVPKLDCIKLHTGYLLGQLRVLTSPRGGSKGIIIMIAHICARYSLLPSLLLSASRKSLSASGLRNYSMPLTTNNHHPKKENFAYEMNGGVARGVVGVERWVGQFLLLV